jgi:hypothetical protein
MPTGPKGEKRLANAIGNVIKVMRLLDAFHQAGFRNRALQQGAGGHTRRRDDKDRLRCISFDLI